MPEARSAEVAPAGEHDHRRPARHKVFVSYSRRQYYAAHQLSTALAEHGLDPWFDSERLVPGRDWTAAIDRAIDEADALVVVASPDAIASEYVTREWKRAQRNGTPVYVALARHTSLPAELAGAPRIDLRGRFPQRAAELADAVGGNNVLPKPHRWTMWPGAVLVVAAGLAFNLLTITGQAAAVVIDLEEELSPLQLRAMVVTLACCLAYIGYLGLTLARFCRGRARFTTIAVPLFGTVPLSVALLSVFASVIAEANHGRETIRSRSLDGDLSTPFLFVDLPLLLINVVALVFLFRSTAVLRWLPPGESSQRLRKRMRHRRIQHDAGPAVTSIAIHHPPADHAIAEQIRTVFRLEGIHTVTENPDVHLVVVSNGTRWDEAAELLAAGGSIAVLVSSVRLPDDADLLRRNQWVDYRDTNTERLHELAAAMARPDEPAPIPTIPRSAHVFDAPRPAKIVIECLIALVAVYALSALLTAIATPPPSERVTTDEPRWVLTVPPGPPTGSPTQPRFAVTVPNPDYPKLPEYADALLAIRALLAVGMAVLALALAIGLGQRKIHYRAFTRGMAVLLGLSALWVLLGIPELRTMRLIYYVVLWTLAVATLVRASGSIGKWLPDTDIGMTSRLRPVSASLLPPSLPFALVYIAQSYAGGSVF